MANTQEKQFLSKKSCTPVYHVDAFTFEDGHLVGHDGFVVPRDFTEFFERFPLYVSNWVRKRLRWSGSESDVQEWTQELLMHLHSLPPSSKHRLAGKQDVVQLFNPEKMHGANEARFRSFINRCLANKFNTIYLHRKKEPLSNPSNLLLATVETHEPMVASDEYCHEKSASLQQIDFRRCKQRDDEFRLNELSELADACELDHGRIPDDRGVARNSEAATSQVQRSEVDTGTPSETWKSASQWRLSCGLATKKLIRGVRSRNPAPHPLAH